MSSTVTALESTLGFGLAEEPKEAKLFDRLPAALKRASHAPSPLRFASGQLVLAAERRKGTTDDFVLGEIDSSGGHVRRLTSDTLVQFDFDSVDQTVVPWRPTAHRLDEVKEILAMRERWHARWQKDVIERCRGVMDKSLKDDKFYEAALKEAKLVRDSLKQEFMKYESSSLCSLVSASVRFAQVSATCQWVGVRSHDLPCLHFVSCSRAGLQQPVGAPHLNNCLPG